MDERDQLLHENTYLLFLVLGTKLISEVSSGYFDCLCLPEQDEQDQQIK